MKNVVGVLNKQKAAINEALAVAPVALTNLDHTYNATAGTLDTRDNLGGTQNPLDPAVICAALEDHRQPAGQRHHRRHLRGHRQGDRRPADPERDAGSSAA